MCLIIVVAVPYQEHQPLPKSNQRQSKYSHFRGSGVLRVLIFEGVRLKFTLYTALAAAYALLYRAYC